MKAIIGKKIEMTQIFTPEGVVLPVTKIKVEPVTVIQIKTTAKDGYAAVQIGSGNKRQINKPLMGHFKGGKYRYVKEFKIEAADLKIGDSWGINMFVEGEKVKVVGTSKGKGFQGVVKRWGFAGSPATHGHKDQLRMPGSIGATGPARVFKGTRMGGHMGAKQITVKWLEIVKIDKDENIVYIKGAVPGARNGILYIIMKEITFLVQCADSKGLLAGISSFFYDKNFNIDLHCRISCYVESRKYDPRKSINDLRTNV